MGQAPTGHARQTAWIAATAMMGALLACKSEMKPEEVDQRDRLCAREGNASRFVYLDSCRHDGECPTSMRCRIDDPVAGDGASGECVFSGPSAGVNSRTLTSGFNKRLMDLALVPGSNPAAFEFLAPNDAIAVNCALFRCPPQIIVEDGVARIANYTKCVESHELFSNSIGRFELNFAEHPTTLACGLGDPMSDDLRFPRPRGFSVACWAWDDTSLFRATRLLAVEPTLLVPQRPRVESDCERFAGLPLHESPPCVLPGDDVRIGVCMEGQCTSWCEDTCDCVLMDVLRPASQAQRDEGPSLDGTGSSTGSGVPEDGVVNCENTNYACLNDPNDSSLLGACVLE